MRNDHLHPALAAVLNAATPAVRGYVVYVNRECSAVGPSHAVVGWDGAKPILACGTDSGPLNWTLNPTARTEVCRCCAHRRVRA